MKKALAVLSLAFVGAVFSAPASADTLYSNGYVDGHFDAWDIGGGFSISDSFTLTKTSTVTGVNFGAWVDTGDSLTSVGWSIGTTPFGGTVSDASTTGTFRFANGTSFDIYTEGFSTGSLVLGPGTYYLTLQDAVTADGTIPGWDIDDGPSTAYSNLYGNVNNFLEPGTNSESFYVYGVVPEPSSLLLMVSGLACFAGLMRGKLKT